MPDRRTAVTSRARRPTMRDVADEAAVSLQTVSNVINGQGRMAIETRTRVEGVIARLGYHPNNSARGLRSLRTSTLAFLVLDEHAAFLADPLTDLIIAGVGDVARERGYGVLIQGARPGAHDPRFLAPLREARVDGAFVLLSGEPAIRRSYVDELEQIGTPFVLFDEPPPSASTLSVRADQRAGAVRLTEYLLGRGHRRIGFLAARVPWPVVEERYAGFGEALARAGIEHDPSLDVFDGTYEPDGGGRMMQGLLDRPEPPTAVLCGSDLLAIGAIGAMRQRGLRVPDDIAVCGYDDFAFARFFEPALTTVHVPGYEMGRAGASLLFDRLAGRAGRDNQVVLPVELRIRRSA